MQDTTTACRITGIEIQPPAEQQHVSIQTPRSFNRSSSVHWSTPSRRARVPAGKLIRGTAVDILHKVFVSDKRQHITRAAENSRQNAGVRALINGKCDYWTYRKVYRAVDHHFASCSTVPTTVPPTLATYLADMSQIVKVESKKRNLVLKQNNACIVYGLLQLLACGFSPGGVKCIRQIEFVHEHGLSPTQYAKLPGIRARQQTIAVRQIQRVCVDESGHAVLQLPLYNP